MARSLGRSLSIQNIEFLSIDRPKEDAVATWADTRALSAVIGSLIPADFDRGIDDFVEWFQKHKARIH